MGLIAATHTCNFVASWKHPINKKVMWLKKVAWSYYNLEKCSPFWLTASFSMDVFLLTWPIPWLPLLSCPISVLQFSLANKVIASFAKNMVLCLTFGQGRWSGQDKGLYFLRVPSVATKLRWRSIETFKKKKITLGS